MNLQQRILLMFADYRDLLSREQKAAEEMVRLRSSYEALEQRFEQFQKDAIERERQLTDRFLSGNVQVQAPRGHSSESAGQQAVTVGPAGVKQWHIDKRNEFREALEKRRQALVHKAEQSA